MRYKLTIEYEGTGFYGWQRQDSGPSVQQAIEEAITQFCGETLLVYAAGRTDSGVHATGQVAHFEITREFPEKNVRDAINFHMRFLPVRIISAEKVSDDFHARFSAIERAYLYRISNRRVSPSLDKNRVWWISRPLDAQAMAEGAERLLGRHDFTSFRAAECQADSALKTLDELSVYREGDEIRVVARARSFLHHQVRNMVGTLKLVGEGKWTPDDVTRILLAKDRTKAGQTAPACGLYLTSVGYP
jgi:tRNA pseudouridine38-40 synthase